MFSKKFFELAITYSVYFLYTTLKALLTEISNGCSLLVKPPDIKQYYIPLFFKYSNIISFECEGALSNTNKHLCLILF